MAYSREVKEEVLMRLANGEEINDISSDTGISIPVLYSWKESDKYLNIIKQCEEKETSKEIKTLLRYSKIQRQQNAMEKCKQFPENPVIQSQYISILKKIGTEECLQEALEKCKEFPENEFIQSQYISILKKIGTEEYLQEALEKCKQYPENPIIQYQYIAMIVQNRSEESFEESIRICEKFLNQEDLDPRYYKKMLGQYKYSQSNIASILYKKGDRKSLDRALEICEKFPDDKIIQCQYISILIKKYTKESLEIAYTKCDELFKKEMINQKEYKKMKKRIKKLLEKKIKKSQKISENNSDNSSSNFLDEVKTKLYYDTLSFDDIEQIKQNNSDLDEWEKTVVLLAIYDKQRNIKLLESTLKNAKKLFTDDNEKIKELNKLQNIVLSKKSKIFDWKIYDRILGWELEKTDSDNVEIERENQESHEKVVIENQENKDKPKTELELEENQKSSIIKETKIEKEQPKKVEIQSNIKEDSKEKDVLVKTKKTSVKSPKSIPKEKTIKQVFGNIIMELRARIIFNQSQIVFEDERLKVPKGEEFMKYKVPEEVIDDLKSKLSKENTSIEDLDKTDILLNKQMNDFRAKMQLILLFRKYGMKEVADKKLPLESEIYDGINNIVAKQHQLKKLKITQFKSNEVNSEDDRINIINFMEKNVSETMEKTMNKISQLEGNTDYAYQLLDRALDEDKTR